MIQKYSNFIKENLNIIIKEGTSSNPSILYYTDNVEEFINNIWENISTKRYKDDKYLITFTVGNDKYDSYGVIVQRKNNQDTYYLEDSKLFTEKFKQEFWKNASEYVKNMKYDPIILGDLEHVRETEKYNL